VVLGGEKKGRKGKSRSGFGLRFCFANFAEPGRKGKGKEKKERKKGKKVQILSVSFETALRRYCPSS